ncbi:unnamed protein product [Spodoptera littoralis]|uniref:Uncharacterized protein n=1 Tax=Spodoptera littoralis TaxID=7109 RepID=A0A9P0ILU0_SPOLI|nr:unnamed protein product [Spodoptera littoralis]CAH1647333.1 unnamed protein product [Spodoptera littoralis]
MFNLGIIQFITLSCVSHKMCGNHSCAVYHIQSTHLIYLCDNIHNTPICLLLISVYCRTDGGYELALTLNKYQCVADIPYRWNPLANRCCDVVMSFLNLIRKIYCNCVSADFHFTYVVSTSFNSTNPLTMTSLYKNFSVLKLSNKCMYMVFQDYVRRHLTVFDVIL